MARQAKEAGANTPARGDIIRSVAKQLGELEDKIKVLREQKNEIKNARIKGDLGMKLSDWNMAVRLHRLEGDDRAQAQDTLAEVYAALVPGEQLDWVKAAEGR